MSTILKALRRLEEEQPERPAAGAIELDRQILAQSDSEESRARWRLPLVTAAVVVSCAAGVWVSLAVLSYSQADLPDAQRDAPPIEVVAADSANVAAAPTQPAAGAVTPDPAEEPAVVIVADVLRQRTDARVGRLNSIARAIQQAQRTRLLDASEAEVLAADRVEPAESVPIASITRKPVAASRRVVSREAPVDGAPKQDEDLPQVKLATPKFDPVRAASLRARAAPAQPRPVPPVPVEPTRALVAEVPEIVREPVPSVVVTSTVWHPRPERRLAQLSVLEGGVTRRVELREGQRLGPLRLAEIGMIGVTFVHEGVEIEYQIGGTRP